MSLINLFLITCNVFQILSYNTQLSRKFGSTDLTYIEDMNMKRNPLPDDFDADAISQDKLIFELIMQYNIPLRELVELDLQELYDLKRSLISPDEYEEFERVVVIDNETCNKLKGNMDRMLRHARPDKRGVWSDTGVTSRAIALSHLPDVPHDAPLGVLEAELIKAGFEAQVVVEDNDFYEYGKEMNRIISQRPHGRSQILDHDPDRGSMQTGLDFMLSTIIALTLMTREVPISDGLPNPRRAVFMISYDDDDPEFAQKARSEGTDVIALIFTPGKEHEGPTNIAVYEERHGHLNVWPECSIWGMAEKDAYMIASVDRSTGFVLRQGSILLVRDVPTSDLADRFKEGRRRLRDMID